MSHHERTHAMDLLERKFANDSEAHTLLAMLHAAAIARAPELFLSEPFYARIHACVGEHIRLSGDVYDRR
jgi:hypothetical protein